MTHWSVVKPLASAEHEYPAYNRERYGNSPKARVALWCEVAGTRLRGWCASTKEPLYLSDLYLPPPPTLRILRISSKKRFYS